VTLSSDGVTVGVIVIARCQRGTAFPDGRLTKSLRCVDNFTIDGVTWNDTVDGCQGRIVVTVKEIVSVNSRNVIGEH